jgi:hypothetical protein
VVPPLLVELRKNQGRRSDESLQPVKRRLVFWDRERARAFIHNDYLGPAPTFSLDEFKRIFQISRSTYNV